MEHPDALAGEVYHGNTMHPDAAGVGWKTVRVAVGAQAYDIDGIPIGGHPYFVQASELEAAGVRPRNFGDYERACPGR